MPSEGASPYTRVDPVDWVAMAIRRGSRGADASDLDTVLREQPFAPELELRFIEPLAEDEAHSGMAFRVATAEGRRYKLRICGSARRARELEQLLGTLPEVFPRVVARRARHLLIEWVEGERLDDRKELRPHAPLLGRLFAEVHRLGRPPGWSGRLRSVWLALRMRWAFRGQLRALVRCGLIDPETAARARAAFRTWVRHHGTPICLDLWDTHKANFMLEPDGGLRYVDEEGLAYTLKGMGLAKLLAKPGVRRRQPKREAEWQAFRAGYAEVADAGFLTPDYRNYMRLVELVRSIDSKVRRERRLDKVGDEAAELRDFLAQVKPAEGSSDPTGAPLRGSGAP